MANSNRLVTGPDGVSRLVELTDDEQAAKDAEVKAWADGANARRWAGFRRERNAKLAETDWMANSDVTLASNWKTYRQSLRDLPASAKPKLSSDGSLDMSSVTFPTKPS